MQEWCWSGYHSIDFTFVNTNRKFKSGSQLRWNSRNDNFVSIESGVGILIFYAILSIFDLFFLYPCIIFTIEVFPKIHIFLAISKTLTFSSGIFYINICGAISPKILYFICVMYEDGKFIYKFENNNHVAEWHNPSTQQENKISVCY